MAIRNILSATAAAAVLTLGMGAAVQAADNGLTERQEMKVLYDSTTNVGTPAHQGMGAEMRSPQLTDRAIAQVEQNNAPGLADSVAERGGSAFGGTQMSASDDFFTERQQVTIRGR